MKKIQMVDLVGQYQAIKDEIAPPLQNILDTAAFINGPEVKAFEAELAQYLNVKHVIGCANGTDALQVAMMALGLQPGDEVIVPDFTYIATVEVIALLRLQYVVADVDYDTFNLNIDSLRKAITPKTKAIVPVHLYGMCSNMEQILQVAREHNLFVIEDNAQAIGAEYTFSDGRKQFAGTMGNVGTTSFYPSKNLSCYGDGGALFTNDDELAAKLRMIANHGQNRRYYFDAVGVNSRLDSIQAAILRVKLRHLNRYTDARRALADAYDQAFANHPHILTPARAPYSTHVFHQYTIRVVNHNRDGLQEFLAKKDIPSVIFYPLPVHQQTAYLTPRFTDDMFPVSCQLAREVLSLPMHTEMEADQRDYIIESVREYFKK
jgi:dTDP-4-amino-4,6-dideoxygalactose transaminase